MAATTVAGFGRTSNIHYQIIIIIIWPTFYVAYSLHMITHLVTLFKVGRLYVGRVNVALHDERLVCILPEGYRQRGNFVWVNLCKYSRDRTAFHGGFGRRVQTGGLAFLQDTQFDIILVEKSAGIIIVQC